MRGFTFLTQIQMSAVFLLFAIIPGIAWSKTGTQTSFADEIKWGERTLVLNGVGIRKATIFSVKVYEAALYLEKKENNPDLIINSLTAKKISMIFLRSVDRESINKAWKESLEKNCHVNCPTAEVHRQTFLDMMSDVKKNDLMDYQFSQQGLTVSHNNQEKGQIKDPEFARLVLSTWLGKHPPTEELKSGLLGEVQK